MRLSMKNFSVLFILILLLTLSACSNDDNEEKQPDEETESETTQSETTIDEEEQQDDNNQSYEDRVEEVKNDLEIVEEELVLYNEALKEQEEDFTNIQVVDLQEFYYGGKLPTGEDKLTITFGMFELSNYYNYGFRDAKDTFQAFEITDINDEKIYGYVERDTDTYYDLLDAIDNGNSAQYLIIVEYNTIDTGSQHMVGIMDIFEAEFEQ